ncbi:MAG TPA: PD-(D/E)XK nuclease family protein [Natronosporangium sp.]
MDQQPELPGMPEPLVVATPSKLAAYEDCPRRYRFAYVDRPAPPKGPPWAHNSLGASIHTALRNWYDLPPARRGPAQLPGLLKATWVREGYRDLDQERAAWRRALRWLEAYVGSMPVEPLGVERVVAARTPVIAFHGRADRIDARPAEGMVIVDYKTGRSQPGEAEARGSAALALYAFAAAKLFRRPCRRVELHHLPTGTVAAAELTDESIARQVQRAEATAMDIRAAERATAGGTDPDVAFPANPGSQCGWCDYRRVCPAGRELPGKEPWAGLPDPSLTVTR